jgi:hypothetical protein
VEENYQTAFEHTPEVFSAVTMLYVDMEARLHLRAEKKQTLPFIP